MIGVYVSFTRALQGAAPGFEAWTPPPASITFGLDSAPATM